MAIDLRDGPFFEAEQADVLSLAGRGEGVLPGGAVDTCRDSGAPGQDEPSMHPVAEETVQGSGDEQRGHEPPRVTGQNATRRGRADEPGQPADLPDRTVTGRPLGPVPRISSRDPDE